MRSVAQGRSSFWWASCRHVDLELCAGTAVYPAPDLFFPRHDLRFYPSSFAPILRRRLAKARSRLSETTFPRAWSGRRPGRKSGIGYAGFCRRHSGSSVARRSAYRYLYGCRSRSAVARSTRPASRTVPRNAARLVCGKRSPPFANMFEPRTRSIPLSLSSAPR
jgi:hypothetical protein